MKVIEDYPPNFQLIDNNFNLSGMTPVFTYGDCLYNPWGGAIPQHLMVHEKVHALQQENIGSPDIWWHKYINSREFRLSQEIEAYHAQYEYFKAHNNGRQQHFNFLLDLSRDLSSEMYGELISTARAMHAIDKCEDNRD